MCAAGGFCLATNAHAISVCPAFGKSSSSALKVRNHGYEPTKLAAALPRAPFHSVQHLPRAVGRKLAWCHDNTEPG